MCAPWGSLGMKAGDPGCRLVRPCAPWGWLGINPGCLHMFGFVWFVWVRPGVAGFVWVRKGTPWRSLGSFCFVWFVRVLVCAGGYFVFVWACPVDY